MPNGNWDDMNNDGNKGLGLLGVLGLLVAGGMIKSRSNSKKEQEIQALQRQLQDVRYELSKKRGSFLREVWNTAEIEELERQEAEILRRLKELGG